MGQTDRQTDGSVAGHLVKQLLLLVIDDRAGCSQFDPTLHSLLQRLSALVSNHQLSTQSTRPDKLSHHYRTRTYTHPSIGPVSGTTRVIEPVRGVVGQGRGGTASPHFFRQGERVPHSPHFFGLKFVQKLVHCCNGSLTSRV